jgi:anti-sigma B factor antagonist
MQTSSIINDHTPVIRLTGQIDFSSRKTLRALIDEGLAQGRRDFILDLQDVTFIDSSGLGALVACFSTVRKQGGSMKLVHVPELVYELMEITRLTHFFDICDSPQPSSSRPCRENSALDHPLHT